MFRVNPVFSKTRQQNFEHIAQNFSSYLRTVLLLNKLTSLTPQISSLLEIHNVLFFKTLAT